jgi:hypothetical protein
MYMTVVHTLHFQPICVFLKPIYRKSYKELYNQLHNRLYIRGNNSLSNSQETPHIFGNRRFFFVYRRE